METILPYGRVLCSIGVTRNWTGVANDTRKTNIIHCKNCDVITNTSGVPIGQLAPI